MNDHEKVEKTTGPVDRKWAESVGEVSRAIGVVFVSPRQMSISTTGV